MMRRYWRRSATVRGGRSPTAPDLHSRVKGRRVRAVTHRDATEGPNRPSRFCPSVRRFALSLSATAEQEAVKSETLADQLRDVSSGDPRALLSEPGTVQAAQAGSAFTIGGVRVLGARAGACERRTLVAGQIRSERRSRRPTSHPSPITTRAGSITRKAAARNPIANAGTSNDAAR